VPHSSGFGSVRLATRGRNMAQTRDQAWDLPTRVTDRFGARRAWARSLLCSNDTGGHCPQGGVRAPAYASGVCTEYLPLRRHAHGDPTSSRRRRYGNGREQALPPWQVTPVWTPRLPEGARARVCSDALTGVHCGAGCGCLFMRVARTRSPAPFPPAVELSSYWCRANRERAPGQTTKTVPCPVGTFAPERSDPIYVSGGEGGGDPRTILRRSRPRNTGSPLLNDRPEEYADRPRRRAEAPFGDTARARAPRPCLPVVMAEQYVPFIAYRRASSSRSPAAPSRRSVGHIRGR
jgi:hypothetical protein